MINALGNYIGNSTPTQPVIINGFIQNVNINDETAYLIINYESGNANPLNGTGSFQFDSPKEIEYFIVAAGGDGGRASTSFSSPIQCDFGAGGGAGGISSGSLLLEKDKEYTAIAASSAAVGSKGANSFFLGPTIPTKSAIGGGNGGNVFLNVAPGEGTGSNGGAGGGGGYAQRIDFARPGGIALQNSQGVGDYLFPTAALNGTASVGFGHYTEYGTSNGQVSGSAYATLVNSNRALYSFLSGSYVDIALPGGGMGASGNTQAYKNFGTASAPIATVGTVDYFGINYNPQGGDGILSSITGTPTYYAGGGAGLGAAVNNETSPNLQFAPNALWSSGSIGGLGGGGSSTGSIGSGGNAGNHNGVDGLGGGAGPGGTGGSGVVIIRYSRNQQDLIRS